VHTASSETALLVMTGLALTLLADAGVASSDALSRSLKAGLIQASSYSAPALLSHERPLMTLHI
jgi:hypothetical protein